AVLHTRAVRGALGVRTAALAPAIAAFQLGQAGETVRAIGVARAALAHVAVRGHADLSRRPAARRAADEVRADLGLAILLLVASSEHGTFAAQEAVLPL